MIFRAAIPRAVAAAVLLTGAAFAQEEEALKVPVWAGVALYGDYCYTDYTDVLPTITVPVIVFSADSGIFPRSIEQGRAIAAMIPRATFVPFEKGGHALFYYEAEKFNQAVRDFARKAKAS
jgi:pimeloyl-ACP methyl ester carboxylesterase